MAADLRLERYVQRKARAGCESFYFSLVRNRKEERHPLPHPFSAEYRAAYDAVHRAVFSSAPGDAESPTGIAAMVRQHRESERYKKLPRQFKSPRNMALALMEERWGIFEAAAIRPIHVQALYDSLAERPATANRRLTTSAPYSPEAGRAALSMPTHAAVSIAYRAKALTSRGPRRPCRP